MGTSTGCLQELAVRLPAPNDGTFQILPWDVGKTNSLNGTLKHIDLTLTG